MRTMGLASPEINLGNGNELIWISPYELVKLPSHSHAQTNASNDIMRMDCQTRHLFPSSSQCCVFQGCHSDSLLSKQTSKQSFKFIHIHSQCTTQLNLLKTPLTWYNANPLWKWQPTLNHVRHPTLLSQTIHDRAQSQTTIPFCRRLVPRVYKKICGYLKTTAHQHIAHPTYLNTPTTKKKRGSVPLDLKAVRVVSTMVFPNRSRLQSNSSGAGI